IVSTGYRETCVWNVVTGAAVKRGIPGASSAWFSPGGQRVLTVGFGARVWEAATGRAVTPLLRHRQFRRLRHAAFSPDGRRVVTAGRDGPAQVWEAASGAAVGPPLSHANEVTYAAFSPDGRQVVTASADRTARVWDVGTGKPVAPPLEHKQ